MKNYLLFSVFALFTLNIFSQTTISGTVSQQNGGSLPGASIYLQGTYDGVSSDTSGRFSFKTSKTGKFVVSVTFMGCEPFAKEIVLNGAPVNLAVVLKETFNQLNAVTITAGTFEASDKKQANILMPQGWMCSGEIKRPSKMAIIGYHILTWIPNAITGIIPQKQSPDCNGLFLLWSDRIETYKGEKAMELNTAQGLNR